MRKLREVAGEIRRDWKRVNYAAAPYLDAMGALDSIEQNYIVESGRSIVARFLANAGSWRGETARRVKAELREMVR